MGLYNALADRYGWAPNDIDDADLETLFGMLGYKDPDTMEMNGKIYRRATKPPAWL